MTITEAFEILNSRGFVPCNPCMTLETRCNSLVESDIVYDGNKWREAVTVLSKAYEDGKIIIKEE